MNDNDVIKPVHLKSPLLTFVAVGLFIGAASGLSLPVHPFLFGCVMIVFCFSGLLIKHEHTRFVIFAGVVFFMGALLSSQQDSANKQPFFLDSDVQIRRVVLSEFGQSLSFNSLEIHQPAGLQLQRYLHAYVPAVPVCKVDDVYRVRGLCEWNEKYHSWQLRVASMELKESQQQSARADLWQHVDALAPHQGLAAALLLGSAPREAKQQFRDAGVAHVLVVSGLHVGIVFVLVASCLRLVAMPWYPAQIVLIGVLCFYLWMTGFAIPTQRAVLMGMIIIVANLIARDLHPYAALSLTIILLVLWDPISARGLSFQLSAAAVAGILSLGLALRRLRLQHLPLQAWPLDRPIWKLGLYMLRSLIDGMLIGLAATLAVTPILAVHIGVCNPWSPLATVLITPLVTVAIACGGMWLACMSVWASGPWSGLYVLCDWSFQALDACSTFLARFPGADLQVEAPPIYVLCLWPLLFLPLHAASQLLWRGAFLCLLIILWIL